MRTYFTISKSIKETQLYNPSGWIIKDLETNHRYFLNFKKKTYTKQFYLFVPKIKDFSIRGKYIKVQNKKELIYEMYYDEPSFYS